MNRSVKLVIAFALLFTGFLSFLMSMLGLQFTFLRWLEQLPGTLNLLIKLGMFVGGIILAYITIFPPKND